MPLYLLICYKIGIILSQFQFVIVIGNDFGWTSRFDSPVVTTVLE